MQMPTNAPEFGESKVYIGNWITFAICIILYLYGMLDKFQNLFLLDFIIHAWRSAINQRFNWLKVKSLSAVVNLLQNVLKIGYDL